MDPETGDWGAYQKKAEAEVSDKNDAADFDEDFAKANTIGEIEKDILM